MTEPLKRCEIQLAENMNVRVEAASHGDRVNMYVVPLVKGEKAPADTTEIHEMLNKIVSTRLIRAGLESQADIIGDVDNEHSDYTKLTEFIAIPNPESHYHRSTHSSLGHTMYKHVRGALQDISNLTDLGMPLKDALKSRNDAEHADLENDRKSGKNKLGATIDVDAEIRMGIRACKNNKHDVRLALLEEVCSPKTWDLYEKILTVVVLRLHNRGIFCKLSSDKKTGEQVIRALPNDSRSFGISKEDDLQRMVLQEAVDAVIEISRLVDNDTTLKQAIAARYFAEQGYGASDTKQSETISTIELSKNPPIELRIGSQGKYMVASLMEAGENNPSLGNAIVTIQQIIHTKLQRHDIDAPCGFEPMFNPHTAFFIHEKSKELGNLAKECLAEAAPLIKEGMTLAKALHTVLSDELELLEIKNNNATRKIPIRKIEATLLGALTTGPRGTIPVKEAEGLIKFLKPTIGPTARPGFANTLAGVIQTHITGETQREYAFHSAKFIIDSAYAERER